MLVGDIQKVRECWIESTAEAPHPRRRLQRPAHPWQKLRELELGISGDPAERPRLQRELVFWPVWEVLPAPQWTSMKPSRSGSTP